MGLTYPSNKICPRCGTGGYVWYLDNSEYVAKCINCNHYFRKEDFPMCVLDEAPKPMTKADRFRSMSDEELARFIARFEDLCVRHAGVILADDLEELVKCRLEWLREEYKE